MNTTTPTAVAWSLRAPSTTGGKEYRVLLFDRYVLIGWGAISRTMQYKVHMAPSATAARLLALDLTATKEAGGYHLFCSPVRSNTEASEWTVFLPKYYSHRGSSPVLDAAFNNLFSHGTPIAA
jgi:predicted DNA-binding WGR domain protein